MAARTKQQSKPAAPQEEQAEPKSTEPRPFVFLHIGDLHVTGLRDEASPSWVARETQLKEDLANILADIEAIHEKASFDFVYLPGDLAENGCEDEYDVIAGALAGHQGLKVRLIPGDHDRARGAGSLNDFEAFRSKLTGAHRQPDPSADDAWVRALVKRCPPDLKERPKTLRQFFFCEEFNGVSCLFLDMVSAGVGQKGLGLDFRLGAGQAKWLADQIREAHDAKTPCAVFMHCYPSDMHEPDEGAAVAGLIRNGGVKIVEMGHTHYNEVCHDGRTMYAAARSVGQNEDGPAGFAVGALDDGVTSWRFKQLQLPYPFVLITSPADRRLATEPLATTADHKITVRALVLSDAAVKEGTVTCCVDGGIWRTMRATGAPGMYDCDIEWLPGSRTISVKVEDARSFQNDRVDSDSIEPAPTSADFAPAARSGRFGSPDFQIGAWPVKGLRGDRLGPNNGGHKW